MMNRNCHDNDDDHGLSSFSIYLFRTKCIGITIETRPDYCLKPHLNEMLSYGCTRIEIGVQSIYEDVARDTNRGHTVAAVCNSFHLAKDCGFKVVTHMMPDLPNMGRERDLDGFKEYFENPKFRSDGLKIYPTLVIRGTGLYELWKTGRYKNYTPDEMVDVIAQILAMVPPWTRVYRIQVIMMSMGMSMTMMMMIISVPALIDLCLSPVERYSYASSDIWSRSW